MNTILNKDIKYFCPCCKSILMESENYIFCPEKECKCIVQISKVQNFLKIYSNKYFSIKSSIHITLNKNLLKISIGNNINFIEYQPLKNFQETLLDIFRIYEKYEDNLLFL